MASTTTSCLTAETTSVPFKFTVSQSRRRSRLKIPVRLDDLRAVIIASFPELKGRELKITYTDDENDDIIVLSDAELEEALSIFNKLGRILSFTVTVASNESNKMSAPSLPAATMHCKKKAETSHVQKAQIQIVLENGSLARLLPNNIIVTPKPGKRTHLSTASIPGLTVNNGKWIYEVVLGSDNISKIGWADAHFSCSPLSCKGVGDDEHSWAMDGCRLIKIHNDSPTPFGRRWGANGWQRWKVGDVLGCVYDADKGEISFLINGIALGLAFCIPAHTPLRPAASLSASQKLRFSLYPGAIKFPVVGATPIANILSPAAEAPSAPKPAPIPATTAVSVSTPVALATPVTVAATAATTSAVRATPVPTGQSMKFGLHPGPFFIVDRLKASRTSSGYLNGFVCDVRDISVCSQSTDTHTKWYHCPAQQYDVCRGCFMKYMVPASAAPSHFSVVPSS